MPQYGDKVRIAVVTGAAGGIGLAIAQSLANKGVRRVVLVDKSPKVLQASSLLPNRAGLGIIADCSQESELERVVLDVEAAEGPIGLFVANAGIMNVGSLAVSNSSWDLTWRVNVMQSVWVAKHLIPRMLSRGGGDLVITASAAGLLSQIGSFPYSVTKAAAVSVAEWLAITYGTQGIRVSCLCPQAVRTDMTHGFEKSVAAKDGLLEPEHVGNMVVENLSKEKPDFLVLPHPTVVKYMQNKGNDRQQWIEGMQGLNARALTAMTSSKL